MGWEGATLTCHDAVDGTARVIRKSDLYKAAVGGQETGISRSPGRHLCCAGDGDGIKYKPGVGSRPTIRLNIRRPCRFRCYSISGYSRVVALLRLLIHPYHLQLAGHCPASHVLLSYPRSRCNLTLADKGERAWSAKVRRQRSQTDCLARFSVPSLPSRCRPLGSGRA